MCVLFFFKPIRELISPRPWATSRQSRLYWRIKSHTPFFKSYGASQEVTPSHHPPPLPIKKSYEWKVTHQLTPAQFLSLVCAPLRTSSSFSRQGLLKGAWLHFQLGATGGAFPPVGWAGNEGCAHSARCISIPYQGGEENYLFLRPLSLSLTPLVALQWPFS